MSKARCVEGYVITNEKGHLASDLHGWLDPSRGDLTRLFFEDRRGADMHLWGCDTEGGIPRIVPATLIIRDQDG